jgi:hypothetical protein
MQHPFAGLVQAGQAATGETVKSVETSTEISTSRRGLFGLLAGAAATGAVVALGGSEAEAQVYTTRALGEEGGRRPTTLMLGEEGGGQRRPTTRMYGEEGGGRRRCTTRMFFEEGGRRGICVRG